MGRQSFALHRQARRQLNLQCDPCTVVVDEMSGIGQESLGDPLVNCLPIEPCKPKAEVPVPVVFSPTGSYTMLGFSGIKDDETYASRN